VWGARRCCKYATAVLLADASVQRPQGHDWPFLTLDPQWRVARKLCVYPSMDSYAIAIRGDHLSPAFDWSPDILFVSDEGVEETINVSLLTPMDRVDLLQLKRTRVLVCGGISDVLLARLHRCGVRVVSRVGGTVTSVRAALADGRLFRGDAWDGRRALRWRGGQGCLRQDVAHVEGDVARRAQR
jgi:hypothetical protein